MLLAAIQMLDRQAHGDQTTGQGRGIKAVQGGIHRRGTHRFSQGLPLAGLFAQTVLQIGQSELVGIGTAGKTQSPIFVKHRAGQAGSNKTFGVTNKGLSGIEGAETVIIVTTLRPQITGRLGQANA